MNDVRRLFNVCDTPAKSSKMYGSTIVFLLVVLTTAFPCSGTDDSGADLLKVPLTRHRKLTDNFDFFNANEVFLNLHNNHNWSYSAEMTIGNPPQRLRIEFDTGSSDLWVAGPVVCKVNPTFCKTHRTYNHSASSTYKSVEGQLKLPYGTEVIDINIAMDDFEIAGLKIKNQFFGEAYNIENAINDEKYPDNKDGIFGLSFQDMSGIYRLTGETSPLMNLIHQGQLPQPVFAFYLTHPMSQHMGELVLGGVDPKRYTGDFVFADVIADRTWTILVDELYFGDKQIGKDFPALVDSGTSLITGPAALIDPIREDTFGPNKTKTSVPCTKASVLPDVTFVISGHRFVLTGGDYIVKEYSNVTCVFGFYPTKSADLKAVILGNVFMRKFYSLFDLGKKRIGFASAKLEDDKREPANFNILAS